MHVYAVNASNETKIKMNIMKWNSSNPVSEGRICGGHPQGICDTRARDIFWVSLNQLKLKDQQHWIACEILGLPNNCIYDTQW